jgi:hypothetical protein
VEYEEEKTAIDQEAEDQRMGYNTEYREYIQEISKRLAQTCSQKLRRRSQ